MIKKIPFFQHDIGQPELDAIAKVFASSVLTTGDVVAEFEQKFAHFLNAKHSIGVTSCTGAIHISLEALGISKDDEIITTPMTFIATSNAIMHSGAKPVFVDVENDTGNINADLIESAITERTKAIVVVHLYGQMCDMRKIRQIADKHNLKIIEDCAHCIEGERDGIKPAQVSDSACFSFYATKNMTCGEGGAIALNNSELADQLKLFRLHGMNKNANDRAKEGYKHWDMTLMGWKYNMDNIQASMLLPQLDRILINLKKRQMLADYYTQQLDSIEEITLPAVKENTTHCRHLFPMWCDEKINRDELILKMQNLGVSAMVNYRPIHLTSFYSNELGYKVGDFPIAERIGNQTISLPFYPNMSFEDVDYVVKSIKQSI